MTPPSEKPAICYETGLDEAFLVGTRDELTSFAHFILDALAGSSDTTDYLGIKVQSVSASLTEVMAEVVLDGIIIVGSKHDRQDLMNRILVNNGEQPIDWVTREKTQKER